MSSCFSNTIAQPIHRHTNGSIGSLSSLQSCHTIWSGQQEGVTSVKLLVTSPGMLAYCYLIMLKLPVSWEMCEL